MEKKMIKVNNSYEKLREVVLGNLDKNILDLVKPEHYAKIEFIFDKTIEEFGQLEKVFNSLDVKVHRPNKDIDITKTFVTPFYEMEGHKVPYTPRDYFLVLGNTIIEVTSWCKEASFTSFWFRDIFLEKFNQGANWISMPLASHNSAAIDSMDDEIPNYEPMIDAPSLIVHDDVIFQSGYGSNNDLGSEWIKRHFPNYTYIELDRTQFVGHLDSHMNIVAPGKILTWHPREHFPEYFKSWDFIQLDGSIDILKRGTQKLLDGRIQDDDFANTILCANSLSIDQNTIMMADTYKDIGSKMIKEIEKRGIDIVWVPYSYQHFFNHGLTCVTLELLRSDD